MSGRQQGLIEKPSHTKTRDGHGQVELGYDNYGQHRHDSRNKQPVQYQESLSPYRGRNREREIPGHLHERREYEWHMRSGRGDQVQSRPAPPVQSRPAPQVQSGPAPPVGRSEKRQHNVERGLRMNPPRVDNHRGHDYADYEDYNECGGRYHYAEYEDYNDGLRRHPHAEYEEFNNVQARYEYADYEDYNNEAVRKPNHEYKYIDSVQIRKEEHSDRRFMVENEHGGMARNLVPVEDGGDPQPVRLRQDRRHGYGQSSHSYPAMEMRRSSKEENDGYQEMPPEDFYVEKCAHQSRKYHHPMSPPQVKSFGNQHHPKGAPSTSSGISRDDFPGRIQDGYPRNPEKLSENLGSQEYGQRQQLEPRQDYEAGYADMKCHQCDPYVYSWKEHEDYVYVNTESRGKDDPGYITHEPMYREDRVHAHVHARPDSEHRHIQRMAIAKPIADTPTEVDGSHIIYSHNGLRERDITQKEELPHYEDMRRPFVASMQEGDSLNSGYAPAEFASRASQDLQLNEGSVFHEHEMPVYGRRYVNVARAQGERVKSSAELVIPEDMQRHVERENRYADEQVAYNRTTVKRKYLQGEEARGSGLGNTASHNKWNTNSGSQQIEERRQKLNNISSSGLQSQAQVPSGREPNLFSEAKDVIDEIYRRKESARYGWSDQGKSENMQEQSVNSFEPGRKYMKVHSKSEFSKGYGRSHYVNHRSDSYKQHYVYKRVEDENCMDVVAHDHNISGNPKGSLRYGIGEDSDAFKKNVLAAFLIYTKKLNENPPIRRLYKDQGNSGTLFCVVCGRSASKIFRDTDGLARHSFMASKASMRAHHLGLHKAICVLMGWDTEIPLDPVTWMPLALSQPKAMAQKEDLIIWQPTVIVHNIALSNSNHKEWKVISLEALEGIVRAKSFIKSRIKICLGYPGDQSVMLVKFLGTFTGLQEAEKLHKYFAENSRGRADFERAISEMNEKSDPSQRRAQEEVAEESLLYGYMGIAEDLDRIDLDTKKRCKIQSKREIQVIADAPLKRD